nr:hypothetical protein JVH1_8346 [Rhodococcus sp. JVH1]
MPAQRAVKEAIAAAATAARAVIHFIVLTSRIDGLSRSEIG